MKLFFVFFLLGLPFFALAEGGKNLAPANTGVATGSNQFIGYLQNGDANNSLSFLAAITEAGFNPDHQLKVRIKPGETLYWGLNRNDAQGGAGANGTVRIQIRRLDNNTIVQTINIASGGVALTAGAGVIDNYTQMVAGPSAIVGGTGYNAQSYTFGAGEPAAIDLAVEILDDVAAGPVYTASTGRDWYNLWDFSVYSGTTERPGRLHAKYWSFSAAGGANRLSTTFRFYTPVPNQAGTNYYVKSINLGGMQPFGFFFTSNSTGSLTDGTGAATSDYKIRRRSKNFYAGVFDDGYPQYNNFVTDPDTEFWPSAAIINPIITTVSKCHPIRPNGGAMDISLTVTQPGVSIILLDLNGVDGYQPSTSDVFIETEITTPGTTVVNWDGLNGLGANVPSGTVFKTVFRFGSFPVHYPIYDAENNSDGFAIFDERPNTAGSGAIAFWDDDAVVAGSSQLFGITSTGAVHPWGGTGSGILAANIGDTRLFNTWIYGQLREFSNTYLHTYSCVTLPPVANNFTNLPMPQTNGATLIPNLVASDPDGTIATYIISAIPLASEGLLTYCSNGTEPCTGVVTTVTAGASLTPAQMATLKFDPAQTFAGTAQFTFTATDNSGQVSNTATYKLPVIANPPIANNIVVTSMPNTNGNTLIQSFSAADADGTINNYTVTSIPLVSEGLLSYCSNGTEPCTGTVTTIAASDVLTPAQMATLKFDPAPGFTGNAVFNYTATDNSGNVSNKANYTIPVTATAAVQTPPLANNITSQLINNTLGATAIPKLTGSDLDGTVNGYTVLSIPPAGEGILLYCPLAPAACTPVQLVAVTAAQVLTPLQAASLHFDPAPGFTGIADFTYTATDDDGNTGNTAVYNIPVVNNPPTVTNITATVLYNAAETAIAPISGADGDGTVVSYTVATIPSAGQGVLLYCPLAPAVCTPAQLLAITAGAVLTPVQAGSLFFDPAPGFSGTTAFNFTALDNNGNVSQPGIYTINIANQPPVAQNITAPLMPNTNGATNIPSLSAADLDGTISSYTIQSIPPASQGALSLSGVPITAGQVLTAAQIALLQFDPAPAFTGNASFSYSATDNTGNVSNLASYNIPVSGTGNIPPVANPVIAPAVNNNSGAVSLSPSLNASDADGTVSSYTITTLPPAFQGQLLLSGVPVTANQVLTPLQISQLQFDPAAGFIGNGTFEYTATDNSGAVSNFATYTIPVFSVLPVASAVVAPVMPNTNGVTAIPSLIAADADGTISSYTISTLPPAAQGVLLLNGVPVTTNQVLTPLQINQLQFDPAPGYTGEVVFNYFATDNNGLISNTAGYTLNVSGVPPLSQDIVSSKLLNSNGATAIPSLNSADSDGSISSYTINNIPPPSQGVLLLSGVPVTAGQVLTPAQISQLQFDPAAGFSGNVLFNYSAFDNGGNLSNTATYVIPVGNGATLPLTLLSFTGAIKNDAALIKWSTETEVNTDYFELQRSSNAVNFITIANVKANGSGNNSYNYSDFNLLEGKVYYRLKMVDVDGRYNYSTIVFIWKVKSKEVKVWPNPFDQEINLAYHSPINATVELRVRDVLGRLMLMQRFEVIKGNNQLKLSQLQNLSKGTYIVEMLDININSRIIFKLSKQ